MYLTCMYKGAYIYVCIPMQLSVEERSERGAARERKGVACIVFACT